MSGFSVNGTGGGPPNTVETLRDHRWLINQLGPVETDQLIFAKDLQLPDLRFDKLEVLGGALWYKFAKSAKWEDITVVFYDTGDMLEQLNKWRDLVFTNDDGIKIHAPSGGYKDICEFILTDGDDVPINAITLHNAWPLVISQGKLTYTSSNIKLISVTLSYDFATP